MFFKDIPFKTREKEELVHQVEDSKIPHAQIFSGAEGSGNLALVLAYISYILCKNKSDGDSCGECKTCKQSHKLIHPDVHFSFPVVKKDGFKREETTSDHFMPEWREMVKSNMFCNVFDWVEAMNGTSTKPNLNIRECNLLIKKLSLQSFADGPKILMIWLPEYLGKEGNRLLKLIEEPTDNTYIILISEDINKILPTVLSRCQLLRVEAYHDEELISYIEKQGESLEKATQLARLSDGNFNKMLKLLAGESKDYSDQLFNWLRVAYKGDFSEMNKFVLELASWSGDQQIQFLQYGIFFLREYLFWTNSGAEPRLSDREIATAQKMTKILDFEKVIKMVDVFEDAIFSLGRNANSKISFMGDTILLGDVLKGIQREEVNVAAYKR